MIKKITETEIKPKKKTSDTPCNCSPHAETRTPFFSVISYHRQRYFVI